LVVVSPIVDVEHDLPRRAWLHAVVVTNRENRPQIREVNVVDVTSLNMPGDSAEAFPEARRPTWAAAHTAAGTDGLAVTGFKV
jgi:hypothetical protein